MQNRAFSIRRFQLILFLSLLAMGYTCSQARGDATKTGGQASGSSPAAADPQPSPGNAAAPAGSAKVAPVIDQRVREVMRGACNELSSAKTITYHAEINFDTVLPSGVKLQYAAEMDTAIKRPNQLAISYKGDLGAKEIWYDGKTLTILDPAHRAYASIPAPDSIDAMLTQVTEEKNLSVPLEGFDFSHPCERVYPRILRGKYVGVNDVGGVDCDHVAFAQQDLDWQLWIDHSGNSLPRKIVITYIKLPAQPQWAAVFSNWHLNSTLPASLFQAKIPKGMIKTSFIGKREKKQ
jgi:hypothetical protein